MAAIVPGFAMPPGRALRGLARLCAAALLLGALGGCAWLDTKLRRIVYRPTPERQIGFDGLKANDVSYALRVPGSGSGDVQSVQLWWMPHADAQAPTLLYLHGTFRNLYRNLGKINALREAGFSVLAVDYRGWGESTPIVPSEESIYADAAAAWAELMRREPEPHRRVLYGHSMGGAVAIELASRLRHGTDYGALIVESTFTRMPDVAAAKGFIAGLLAGLWSEEFASVDKIGRVDAPVLILHGSGDATVPIALARRLRDAAPPGARLVEIPQGSHSRLHSDAPELYRRSLHEFLAGLPRSTAQGNPGVTR